MGQAKNKKQRECPAKGGIITPEDCGRGRNSAISCPVDCMHNPFAPANYESQFGALEIRVIEHLSRKLSIELSQPQIREIADAMGTTIGTVMSRLFYARKKLQTLLKDTYEQL